MGKTMTKVQAASALDSTISAIKNRAGAEFKTLDGKQAIAAQIRSSVSDLESFEVVSIGNTNQFTFNSDATVIGGKVDSVFAMGENSRALESFDALDSSNDEQVKLAAINIVAANMDTQIDGISSLCSVVEIDGTKSGLEILASTPMVLTGSEVINGVSIGGTKVSMLPNITNKSVFGNVRTKLLPILRTTGDVITSGEMVAVLAHNVADYRGESITSAPIATGTGINLRKLCNTNRHISEYGYSLNLSETLSREASLKAVYVKISNAGNTVDNYLKLSVDGLASTRFSDVSNGKGKDISLNFKSEFKLPVSTIEADGILTKLTGVTTNVLTGATITYVIGLSVNALVNTDTMLLDITASGVTLKAVLVNGVEVQTTASEYVAGKAIFDAAKVLGVDANLFLSNSNNIARGITIDIDQDPCVFPAVHKAPVTLSKSIFAEADSSTIVGYLATAKVALAALKSEEIFETLDKVLASIKSKVDSDGFVGAEVIPDGIGHRFIKSMCITDTIDASKVVTQKSGETKNDVAQYMMDNIIASATRLYSDSNFDKSIAVMAPGEVATLSIVTDAKTASYLVQAAITDARFAVEINVTSKFTDRIIATFKIGETVCEVSPIILVQAPDFIYKGIETTGGGNSAVTKIVPRNGIYINAVLFLDFTVSGIKEAFKRP